jgi:uncharacterized membrane protein YedE/YeeE
MNRAALGVGLVFGFVIAGARLSDYNVIHSALLLQKPDLYLLMASAVSVAASLLWLLQRSGWRTPLGAPLAVPRAPIERKHVLGGAVFGAGWALAGTCPGPAIAMTVGGNLLGFVVMAGLTTGVFLRDAIAERGLRAARHFGTAVEESILNLPKVSS